MFSNHRHMEALKHECGVAMIRLRKPLEYYKEKYGSYSTANVPSARGLSTRFSPVSVSAYPTILIISKHVT